MDTVPTLYLPRTPATLPPQSSYLSLQAHFRESADPAPASQPDGGDLAQGVVVFGWLVEHLFPGNEGGSPGMSFLPTSPKTEDREHAEQGDDDEHGALRT